MFLWLVNIGEEFWLSFQNGISPRCPPGDFCPPSCFDSIGNLISCVLPNIYVAAGVILFVLMIIGGVGMIKNASGGDEEGLKKGKQAITSAILGFLIIFVSYWIIQLVQIITRVEIFTNVTL